MSRKDVDSHQLVCQRRAVSCADCHDTLLLHDSQVLMHNYTISCWRSLFVEFFLLKLLLMASLCYNLEP